METMINSALIKQLRQQKAWSQDQLATVSGISLRTIQRIENKGTSSLESRKALASVFGVEANELEVDIVSKRYLKGGRYGYVGAVAGFVSAYVAISFSLINDTMSPAEAGISYSVVATVFGICCVGINLLSQPILKRVS